MWKTFTSAWVVLQAYSVRWCTCGTEVSTWFNVLYIFGVRCAKQDTPHNLAQWKFMQLQRRHVIGKNYLLAFQSRSKETGYAYEAQETIWGELPRNPDTIHGCLPRYVPLGKLLENHPFGHLIAEWEKGVRGMRRINVIHHIAYDNGDETSPIAKHRGRVGRTHSLYALQGLGTEAKAIELLTGSADSNCFNVPPTWE
jgi:hypothetical protein